MELLDDVEFFDCMDTCPDVFSLLDESDINFIEYSNDELFTELSISEEPVGTSCELGMETTPDSSLGEDTSQHSNNNPTCSTINQVSHDHNYAINGFCIGTEYNCVAEQRSLLVDSMVTDESRDRLTVISSNDHTIKLIAITTQEDQGYDTMSSSNSPSEAQETGTPLSILEEKIKRYAKLEVGLTQEEKQCLLAEGLPVPTTLPLTKREEEALKTVRKKLRNKFAAHQSRRRKKEHLELLEQQVRQYGIANHDLQQKVTHLQQENRSLLTELAKLRGIKQVVKIITLQLFHQGHCYQLKPHQTCSVICFIAGSYNYTAN
ncbi:cyclic AMP-responsive element-binding protein 3-like isoform X2 [Dysidea avara]|uniref:cyclic AMP-responsive element-binding protein 3-like isoform X2 n=1 Tax=Dysidea avara TaxID=196820 RepID=UPI00332C8DBC